MGRGRQQGAGTSEGSRASGRRPSGAGLARALRKAKRGKLFESLARVYEMLPETVCENCARCCFESPGVFFVEYLHLLEALSRFPRGRREELARRALRELVFAWIEPERECIFLESSRCILYDRRPLACRLFGLVSPADRERAEAEARMAARQEATRLARLGIRAPEEVVTRSLTSCDRVRDRRGRRVRADAEAMAARVARLDEALLPRQVVLEEFCFRSPADRLGAAVLSAEALEAMRLEMLRRAQRGEAVGSLMDEVWELMEDRGREERLWPWASG